MKKKSNKEQIEAIIHLIDEHIKSKNINEKNDYLNQIRLHELKKLLDHAQLYNRFINNVFQKRYLFEEQHNVIYWYKKCSIYEVKQYIRQLIDEK